MTARTCAIVPSYADRVDEVTGLLAGPRARAAFALRVVMAAPWGLEIRDEAPLSLVAITRGDAHLAHPGHPPTPLGPGDVLLLRGPRPYRVLSAPGAEVGAVVLPGQECVGPHGEPLTERMSLGGRSWGNASDGGTVMLVGSYTGEGEVGRRLLEALPEVLLLTGGPGAGSLADLLPVLAVELAEDRPGQGVVLDRMLDLLVVAAVRRWAERSDGEAARALTAAGDSAVGAALRRIHDEPSRPWTLTTLAHAASLSRSAFSRRFLAATGESPIAYLTRVRLERAADLLADPSTTVSRAGASVGYADPFVFSAAFKRRFGVGPREYGRRARTRSGTG